MRENTAEDTAAPNQSSPDAGDEDLAGYISALEQKYGLVTTDPLPDDVTILVKRLKLLRSTGGRRTV